MLDLYGELVTCDFDSTMQRVRAVYSVREEAVFALNHLHGKVFDDSCLRVYYAPKQELSRPDTNHLTVPLATRQFLISPPPSPPVGWEPCDEEPPVVRTKLLQDCFLHALSYFIVHLNIMV